MSKYSFVFLFILFVSGALTAQTFVNFTTSNGLPDNFTSGIAVDNNNHKWVSTGTGIACYNDTNWVIFNADSGLVDNYTNCIAVDVMNHIWIGTNSGVSMYDGSVWTTFTTNDGLIDNEVHYIAGDIDSSIWFATNTGVSRLKGSTWHNYTSADGLGSDAINFIRVDSAGVKWFGTQMGGLTKYDNNSFVSYNQSNTDSLPDNYITSVALDRQGRIWIGTLYGLTILDASGNWLMNMADTTKIYNGFVRDIQIGPDGNVWLGMFADYNRDGGITWYNGTKWLSYSTPEGLVDKQVVRLAVDHSNAAWIATGNGVSKLTGVTGIYEHPQENILTVFPNPCDGILHLECRQNDSEYSIVNSFGQILIKGVLNAYTIIDTQDWQAGIYFIRLGAGSRKIIISH